MKHTAYDSLKYLIIGSLISADNPNLTEEEKQSIISKLGENKSNPNWSYILKDIKDEGKRNKYIELLEYEEH